MAKKVEVFTVRNLPPLKREASAILKKVFLVEDHPVYAEGLVDILKSEPDLAFCGQSGSAEEALRDIPCLMPDLVLVDITLPGMSGLDLIKRLRPKYPKIKFLVISLRGEQFYAARALRAGGDGYVMKQEDPEEIVCAIRDILGGHIYVSEEVMERASNGKKPRQRGEGKSLALDQLSDSEHEILELLGRGKSSREIARKLHVSEKSVIASRSQIRGKLNLKNAQALFRYAAGWVETNGG